jgi:glycosyltransferase involved in cell wall biosynthesis
MNIVFVTDSARLDGGISQVAIQAAAALARSGHRVYYFCAEGPPDSLLSETVEQIIVQPSAHILTDKNRFRAAVNGIVNRPIGTALARFLKQFDAKDTVVHIHGWCKNLSPLAVRIALRSGLPTVQTLHEYFMVCPNGAFYDFQKGEICQRAPLSFSCVTCHCDSRGYHHKLWRVARSSYQKFGLELPDPKLRYITNSPLSRRIFAPLLPTGAQISHVNNPIGVAPQVRSEVEKNQAVLFVGRFSREKGVLGLAKVVGELKLPAVFVGEGHLRAEMEKLAPHATFTGWLGREEVYEQMRRARVLVFPSTWYETQGLVTVEAAAVGLPSIIADCTAATDFLTNSIRSIHFRHDSTEALKNALLEVRDDGLLQRLSEAAHAWYWNRPWTASQHAQDLEKIYADMLRLSAGHGVPTAATA